jgi:ABC-type transporter Mla MlaB component
MRRYLLWSWLVLALTLACREKTPPSCPAGEIRVNESCAVICNTRRDCPESYVCGDLGYCVHLEGAVPCTVGTQCNGDQLCDPSGYCVALADVPRIDSVTGERTDGTVNAALRVTGARFSEAVAVLAQGGSSYELATCAGTHDGLMILELPAALTPGEYTLSITNQAGTCAQTVQLLQGSPDTPDQVFSKLSQAVADGSTLPGTIAGDTVSTVRAQAEGGGVTRSIRVQGLEQVDSSNNGLFIVVIDRVTHAVQSGSINGAPIGVNYSAVPTDIAGLAGLLGTISPNYLVVLASRGDITTMAGDATLAAAIRRLGGTAVFSTVSSTDQYVLIGIGGLDAGAGLEMIAEDAPAAVATVMIDAAATGLAGDLSP